MISRNTCQTQSLRKLLDDSLSAFEQERLTLHLDDCSQCRESLEKLTADGQWWNDTKESLASWAELATVSPEKADHSCDIHNHITGNQTADHQTKTLKDRSAAGTSSATASATAASHWVKSLLEKSDREDVLGVLDGVTILDVIGQGGMGVVLRG
jgi:serine/threonine-protein kinase